MKIIRSMKKPKALGYIFVLVTLLLGSIAGFANVESSITPIRIQSDGSVSPADAPIQREGDVYKLTGNIYSPIVVDRDNIVIDGAGYTIQGTYNGTRTDDWMVGQGPNQNTSAIPWTIGIDVATKFRNNMTVKNVNLKNFYIGMYVWTSNNTITGCSVTDNIVGILLSGDSNNITGNYVSRNEEGVFFGVNNPGNLPLDIFLTNNSFVDNIIQFSGCFCETYNTTEPIHTWDDGTRGNYWNDYNGTDTNGDGIGDTSYVIDPLNLDRYPLIENLVVLPTPAPTQQPLDIIVPIAIVATLVVVATVVLIQRRSKLRNT
jgi:hypothetical protein